MKKTLLLILTVSMSIGATFQNKNFFMTLEPERDAKIIAAYDEWLQRPKKDSVIRFTPEQKKFIVYNKRIIAIIE